MGGKRAELLGGRQMELLTRDGATKQRGEISQDIRHGLVFCDSGVDPVSPGEDTARNVEEL